MNLKDSNIQSVEIIDKYVSLLKQQEDEFFTLLNKILDHDRELSDSDEWNDKIHYRFTEEYVVAIQTAVLKVSTTLDDARNGLNFARQQYPQ